MKRVTDVLYGMKGYPNAEKFTAFKADLFANGETPGILINKASVTGLSITAVTTNGISITGIPTGCGIKVVYSPTVTSGDVIGQQNRVRIGGTGTVTAYGYQGQTGVLDAKNAAAVYDIWSNPIVKGTTGTGTISGKFVAIRATLETEAIGAAKGCTVTGASVALLIQNQMSGGTVTTGGVFPIYIEMNGGTKQWTADIRLSSGAYIMSQANVPTGITAPKGTIFINTAGSSGTTRFYVNTDGSTTWATFTASA